MASTAISKTSAARSWKRCCRAWTSNLDLGRTFEFSKQIEDKLKALTVEQVNAAFRKYVEPDKLTFVVAGDMTVAAETLLMFAARAEHLERVIRPALAAGTWVLCDRFTDATYAYQSGGRGMPAERVAELEQWVHPDLQPDLTLLFDVPPDVAAQRLARARNADRFEAEELDFFSKVRRSYLERAGNESERFIVIDGTQPADVIGARLTELMQRWNG